MVTTKRLIDMLEQKIHKLRTYLLEHKSYISDKEFWDKVQEIHKSEDQLRKLCEALDVINELNN